MRLGRFDYEYREWQERARNRIRETVIHVIYLSDKHYNGCGFHYGMEAEASYVYSALNNFEKKREVYEQCVIQARMMVLCEQVSKALQDVRRRSQ